MVIRSTSYDDGRVETIRGDLLGARERSDRRIVEDVRRELTESHPDASHVEVTALDAVVRLRGHVLTMSARARAEELASRVAGVKGVENLLTVVR